MSRVYPNLGSETVKYEQGFPKIQGVGVDPEPLKGLTPNLGGKSRGFKLFKLQW